MNVSPSSPNVSPARSSSDDAAKWSSKKPPLPNPSKASSKASPTKSGKTEAVAKSAIEAVAKSAIDAVATSAIDSTAKATLSNSVTPIHITDKQHLDNSAEVDKAPPSSLQHKVLPQPSSLHRTTKFTLSDKNKIIYYCQTGIEAIDLTTKKVAYRFSIDQLIDFQLSEKCNRFVTLTHDGTLAIHDAETGKLIESIATKPSAHALTRDMTFKISNKFVILRDKLNHFLFFSLDNGKLISRFDLSEKVRPERIIMPSKNKSIIYTKDNNGELIGFDYIQLIQGFSISEKQERLLVHYNNGLIMSLDFSGLKTDAEPTEKKEGADSEKADYKQAIAIDGVPYSDVMKNQTILDRILFTDDKSIVNVWDISTGALLFEFTKPEDNIEVRAFEVTNSGFGIYILYNNNSCYSFNAKSAIIQQFRDGHEKDTEITHLHSVEDFLVTGDNSGRICVWNTFGILLGTLNSHKNGIDSLKSKGNVLFSMDKSHHAFSWDLGAISADWEKTTTPRKWMEPDTEVQLINEFSPFLRSLDK